MRLPPELNATRPLKPGTVVVHKNAVGLETYGIIVSEVAGTFQIAYPSRLHRRVRVVPLEDFAPVDQLGVPVAAELQPEDPILTARRALAMDGQALSFIGSNTAEFLSLCLQGMKETHHIDKLNVTLARVATGTIVASLVHVSGPRSVRVPRRSSAPPLIPGASSPTSASRAVRKRAYPRAPAERCGSGLIVCRSVPASGTRVASD